ncbi:Mannose or cellobiose epimerase, N-acyl-D-glucosamine 2-epimerase family [Quadrisphaera granulorum]|uniref:Mannose/cellobiose epimerase-like protein (N-acyl-D-glucosamine 2-epimerase family) n=1 Tax=Quadrisphaera granulorum TaxID=317664 RepID=A0A316A4B4_9ACTN|nr:AGE family epimerase/isomerase [Quadrisphaera granulorum]PWJ52816.1 mannose/cellobiose epimerase-like protein (N-acyl-D-glucosamine 2-epimerase family) [Quadrisphaera granulorum]SZE97421.1 Mannose or cellobiose epimerase, N-acyl-D-glucosamine 2-epimerase family [Quadrisphaera granulorum]
MSGQQLPGWLGQPTHRAWLDEHCRDLLAFGQLFPAEGGGAAWLDEVGEPDPSHGVQTWITARMAHVYSLGHLLGVPGAGALADEALAGLWDAEDGADGEAPLRDSVNGGWFSKVDSGGTPAEGKACYDHAFVILASSTATAAGRPGAAALFDEALSVYEQRFWDEAAGMPVDTWDTAFTTLDDYRGINGAMHSVEACLAASDVLADVYDDDDDERAALWRARALGILAKVADWSSANSWRVPEHFDSSWSVQLEYNADKKADPFKPYGATIGHGLEWSRLLLHGDATARAAGEVPPADFVGAAKALFAQAVADGWHVDGRPGFVYTTDWSGKPVVRDRMHWVPAEATAAAAALAIATGAPTYAAQYALWWDHIADVVLDHEEGSWHHQLDERNLPSGTVWPGKADLYHAVGATLVPRLPLAPSQATAVRQGLLRG